MTEKQIKAERLGGLLGVNRGSDQKPRFLKLTYEPEKPRATVALVGKVGFWKWQARGRCST